VIVSGRDGLPRNVNIRNSGGGLVDVFGSALSILPAGSWMSGDSSMLPAASAAQRMIANDVSLLPLMVYRQLDDVGNAERARDTRQWELLHDEPYPGVPASILWRNVAMGIVRKGNSHALKLKAGKELVALQFMAGRVDRQHDGAFAWQRPDGSRVVDIDPARVVHWPGPNFNGEPDGLSMIELHRTTLDVGAMQETYQRSFYRNGSRPDLAISHPAIKTVEQGDEYIAKHEARHRGAANGHKLMILPGEATVTPISMSFEDAQFIQSKIHTVREVEQIFLMPPGMLHELARPVPDPDLRQRYVRQTIAPVTSIIEGVLKADPDLFGLGSMLYPEFNTAALLKADIQARYAAYLQARQAGWLSPNEIRAAENYPPVDGGDVWQVTPVGGAPNLQPGASEGESNPNPDDAAAARAVDLELRAGLIGALRELGQRRDSITVHPPNIRVEPPQSHVTVEPAQVRVDAPITVEPAQITVEAAQAPNVTVEAPHVHIPEPKPRSIKVNRDKDGRATGYEETPDG
jgi:HK97 family phage portal protein